MRNTKCMIKETLCKTSFEKFNYSQSKSSTVARQRKALCVSTEKKGRLGVGKMAPWLRALAAGEERMGLVPARTWWLTTICHSSFRGLNAFLASMGTTYMWCMYIHASKMFIDTNL